MVDSRTLAAFAGIEVGAKRAATALTPPTDQPVSNAKLQAIVGQADDAVSIFAQTHPQLGPGQLANPLSPFQGDEIFFTYLIPGARFSSHSGEWFEIDEYDWEGMVELHNVWYPRQRGIVSVQDVRRSIYAWIHPVQQTVPPPPEGVDYGVADVRIVE